MLESVKCDFERDFCSWKVTRTPNDPTQQYVWTRRSGSTPSGDTGPKTDHTMGNSSGYYIFVEASQKRSGVYSDLKSPYLDFNNKDYCLELYYHMYGGFSDMGKFEIYGSKDDKLGKKYFQSARNQGDNWIKLLIDLKSSDKIDQVSGYIYY